MAVRGAVFGKPFRRARRPGVAFGTGEIADIVHSHRGMNCGAINAVPAYRT
jgi:hypothetical protein